MTFTISVREVAMDQKENEIEEIEGRRTRVSVSDFF